MDQPNPAIGKMTETALREYMDAAGMKKYSRLYNAFVQPVPGAPTSPYLIYWWMRGTHYPQTDFLISAAKHFPEGSAEHKLALRLLRIVAADLLKVLNGSAGWQYQRPPAEPVLDGASADPDKLVFMPRGEFLARLRHAAGNADRLYKCLDRLCNAAMQPMGETTLTAGDMAAADAALQEYRDTYGHFKENGSV